MAFLHEGAPCGMRSLRSDTLTMRVTGVRITVLSSAIVIDVIVHCHPKLAMGQSDGHRRPRRGQNRRIRTPPRDALSDVQDASVCSKGQWTVRPRRARRSLSHRMAQGSGCARDSKENTWSWPLLGLSQPGPRPDVPAMRQSHSSQATRTGEQKAQGPKKAGQL